MSDNNDLIKKGWENPPEKNKSTVYDIYVGNEPTEEQIKTYMVEYDVGYYVALERLRKITYKKI